MVSTVSRILKLKSHPSIVVGNGFFTMKHRWVNLRDKMPAIYRDLDSFSLHRIVFDEIEQLNKVFFDTFLSFNRYAPEQRLKSTAQQIIVPF